MSVQGDVTRDILEDYTLHSQVGSGSFAVVWKATRKSDGATVAVKDIATSKLNTKLRESLESEISILQRTHHPNIIRLDEIRRAKGKVFLVMEFCSGGDLAQYIRRTGRAVESDARLFMDQLGAGLKVLRAHNLIHRDLKPQNLLLTSPDCRSAVLKIADFGFARSMHPQDLAETLCGSPLYMAPEILQFQKYDAKADLWSVGTILFELLSGRPPFGGANHVQLLRNIERSEACLPAEVKLRLSDECVALVEGLLQRNPVQRLSFEEFFAHPFMTQARVERTGDATRGGTESLHTSRPSQCSPNPSSSGNSGSGNTTSGGSRGMHLEDDALHFVLDDDPASCQPATCHPIATPPIALPPATCHPATSDLVTCQPAGLSVSGAGPSRFSQESWKNIPFQPGTQPTPALMPMSGQLPEGTAIRSTHSAAGQHALTGTAAPRPRQVSGCGSATPSKGLLPPPCVPSRAGCLLRSQVSRAGSRDSLAEIEAGYVMIDDDWGAGSRSLGGSTECLQIEAGGMRASTPTKPLPACVSAPESLYSPCAMPPPPRAMFAAAHKAGIPMEMILWEEAGARKEARNFCRAASLAACAQVVADVAQAHAREARLLSALSVHLLALEVLRVAVLACDPTTTTTSSPAAAASLCADNLGNPSPATGVCPPSGRLPASDAAPREEAQNTNTALVELQRSFVASLSSVEQLREELEDEMDEAAAVPDAIELVFQAALEHGRSGGVEELVGNIEVALAEYARSSALFFFLLVEAPSLCIQPELHLRPMDRLRLRRYASSVDARHNVCALITPSAGLPTSPDDLQSKAFTKTSTIKHTSCHQPDYW